jgi:hypothetical protein
MGPLPDFRKTVFTLRFGGIWPYIANAELPETRKNGMFKG